MPGKGGERLLELSGTEGLRIEILGLSFVYPAELGRIGSQCAKMLVWGIRFFISAPLPSSQEHKRGDNFSGRILLESCLISHV